MYKYKIFLKLSYYDNNFLYKLLKNLNNILFKFFNYTEIKISIINFPNKSNLITVLRSPVIFKKSREQFKKFIYSKGISIKINNKNNFIFIYIFLKKILKKTNCCYNILFKLNS